MAEPESEAREPAADVPPVTLAQRKGPALGAAPEAAQAGGFLPGAPLAALRLLKGLVADRSALLYALLPTLALAAMIALYGTYWSFVAGAARAEVEAWFAARNAEGLEAGYESLSVGGFPYRLEVRLSGLTVADPRVAANWRWTGEAAIVSLQPFRPNHAVIVLPGAQDFTYRPPTRGPGALAERRGWAIETGLAAMSVRVASGRLARASLQLKDFRAQGKREFEDGEIVPMGGFGAALAELHVRDSQGVSAETAASRGNAADIVIRLADVAWEGEAAGAAALPRKIAAFELAATAERLPAFSGSENLIAALIAALRSWADQEGALHLGRLDLTWGDLDVKGSGHLSPSAGGMIEGEIGMGLAGYRPALEAFAAGGGMSGDQAKGLAEMIDGLGAADADPADGRAVIPLRFTEGSIFIGPAKVADLPRLY